MGMVKAGGFLQQSYVAVGELRYPCRPATFLIQDYHLESADIHLNIDVNGQSRRIPPSTKLCGRDPATLTKLEDSRTSL